MNEQMINAYNDIFTANGKIETQEDLDSFEELVNDFLDEFPDADTGLIDKVQKMLDDHLANFIENQAVDFENKSKKLKKEQSQGYDFAGEDDDTAAVNTALLQLMAQLPKQISQANESTTRNLLLKQIESGIVGAKVVLQLLNYPAYADVITEQVKTKALEASKSDKQKKFEKNKSDSTEKSRKETAESYNAGFRARTKQKRLDQKNKKSAFGSQEVDKFGNFKR